jgi:predicted acetyltransferase
MPNLISYRQADLTDYPLLAAMNARLIRDEGHHNPMSLVELEQRMRSWLANEYRAVIFEQDGHVCGYALFRDEPDHIYLRQFLVETAFRRCGIGRSAINWLSCTVWKNRRVRVEALTGNKTGIAFWRSTGFGEYSLTLLKESGLPNL